uniref:C2H2-type domain-containing protein n=1 Tax=Branchiostoma floridae TaxID=7739 RepID=C3Z813_BRAFL|eukprot:XP_002595315.1 hypothetical protein BRAFLDRAFT_87551 [Branchiostoma floridae]
MATPAVSHVEERDGHGEDRSRMHKCGECDKEFHQLSDMKRHMRTHTDEKPFRCEDYSKRFSVLSNLKRHMRTHTEKKYRSIQTFFFLKGLRCAETRQLLPAHLSQDLPDSLMTQLRRMNAPEIGDRVHGSRAPFQCFLLFFSVSKSLKPSSRWAERKNNNTI